MQTPYFPGFSLVLGLPFLVGGCSHDGPNAVYDPSGGFFDQPFPSDERRAANNALVWDDFPNPNDQPLLSAYLDFARKVEGASTMGGIYFRFDAPLEERSLPTPEESLDTSSTVLLIDVDPGSSERGRLVPLSFHWQEEESVYQSSNLLSVGPYPGAPLRPSTTYAALVTTEIAQAHEEQKQVWKKRDSRHGTWLPVEETLQEVGIDPDSIAIGTVFTTQDPVEELAELASWTSRNLAVPTWDQVLEPAFSTSQFVAAEGTLELPLFQHGDKPYSNEGGGFVRAENGDPLISSWETMPFTLAVPVGEDPPLGGWPVVIWAHGTGGNHTNCCNSDNTYETAQMLANASMAVFSVPQPLHGERATVGTIVELHSFNPMNADAARTNFRQGALDIVSLATSISARTQTFEIEGTTHPLNPERVFLAGHSHGGITSALAGAFIGDVVEAMVLSATGGGLSGALTQRKEPIDIEALVHEALGLGANESLHPLHPVSTLIQTIIDVTDPLNYAQYWQAQEGWFSTQPISVLMTEGMRDEPTPPDTIEALAAAGGLPLLTPVASPSIAHDLLNIAEQSPPLAHNLGGYKSQDVTGGLAQFPDQGHFVVFNQEEAAVLVNHFLKTAADGSATIREFEGD